MKKNDYQTDVALLSVTTTEFRAVTYFHDWRAKTFAGDNQTMTSPHSNVTEKHGRSYTPRSPRWA